LRINFVFIIFWLDNIMMNNAIITCPDCEFSKKEIMPSNQCIVFYECENCFSILRPLKNDCCVFCSYSDVQCPPVNNNE